MESSRNAFLIRIYRRNEERQLGFPAGFAVYSLEFAISLSYNQNFQAQSGIACCG